MGREGRMKTADLSLDTIARGALPEKFQRQLTALLENVLDVNTDPKVKRTITIQITFRPEEERTRMAVDVDVTAKLAPQQGDTGEAFIGRREGTGEVVAVTFDPEQSDLFGKGGTDVRPIQLSKSGGAT